MICYHSISCSTQSTYQSPILQPLQFTRLDIDNFIYFHVVCTLNTKWSQRTTKTMCIPFSLAMTITITIQNCPNYLVLALWILIPRSFAQHQKASLFFFEKKKKNTFKTKHKNRKSWSSNIRGILSVLWITFKITWASNPSHNSQFTKYNKMFTSTEQYPKARARIRCFTFFRKDAM